MSDVQKQFKKLDQKAMKLQHKCEKNSQYAETKKTKNLLRLVLFFISVLVCGICVFIVLNKVIENSFTDNFEFSYTPSVLISFFIIAGITTFFFMKKKFIGTVIIFLSIVNLVLAIRLFSNRKLIADNLITIIICSALIICSLIILIKAYRIKRLK